MRATPLLAVAALLPTLSRGQQPVTFDTVRIGAMSYAIGYSVFETDGGYRVFGLDKAPVSPYQDFAISDFSIDGGALGFNVYETAGADWVGTSSPIVMAEVGYYCGMDRYQPGLLDSLFLIRFALDGQLDWERFIAADTAMTMRGLARTEYGDLLIAGLHQYPEEAYVYHVDSLGNIKGYHSYPGFDGEDVVEGRDGKWFVCGRGNQQNNYNHPRLVRSDTLGNVLWSRTQSDLGNYVSLIPVLDLGVVALGIDGHHPDSAGYALAIKYDTNGTEVWRREMFQTDYDTWPSWFHAGYETADSNLVLAGWHRSIATRDQGLLVKLDADGNTIWSRQYTHYPGASYGKDQIFWDVKPTSDGGMVLTGETNGDDHAYAQLWLLKLDSMGCLVPGCGSVGVEEYTDALQPLLRVSPNPASEQVSVELSLPETGDLEGQARVLLQDASGRTVLEQPVQHVTSSAAETLNQLRATVDVSALPAGLYYLHLRDARRWLAGSKLVVE